jgi:hypothetical protein
MDTNMYKMEELVTCKDTAVAHNFIAKAFYNKKNNMTYLYFINRSGSKVQLNLGSGIQLVKHIHAVEAIYPYATAGKTNYEKIYPAKLNAITLREGVIESSRISLAPYSFGYIEYNN